jgi:hypothetical protein
MRGIGQGLRARYEVPKDLPPKLRALVRKLDAGLLFATLWFGGLAVVGWASLQTQGIIGKLIGTFGFIGFVAVLFKFAEWYNKKQKQLEP